MSMRLTNFSFIIIIIFQNLVTEQIYKNITPFTWLISSSWSSSGNSLSKASISNWKFGVIVLRLSLLCIDTSSAKHIVWEILSSGTRRQGNFFNSKNFSNFSLKLLCLVVFQKWEAAFQKSHGHVWTNHLALNWFLLEILGKTNKKHAWQKA